MSEILTNRLRELDHSESRFGPGEFLFRQGDDVRLLYLIEAGEAHLVRPRMDGFVLTLQRAGAGAVLAEASLFSERYHCDAVAVKPARTLTIAKSTIKAKLSLSPAFAEAWSGFLAQEVQATRLRAEILALRTVAERLDAWIAFNDGRLPAKGDWKTLATEIGVSPEALYREKARRRKAIAGP
jgi:CRP-like cAMP-binding protein